MDAIITTSHFCSGTSHVSLSLRTTTCIILLTHILHITPTTIHPTPLDHLALTLGPPWGAFAIPGVRAWKVTFKFYRYLKTHEGRAKGL